MFGLPKSIHFPTVRVLMEEYGLESYFKEVLDAVSAEADCKLDIAGTRISRHEFTQCGNFRNLCEKCVRTPEEAEALNALANAPKLGPLQ
jgi:hypothetical protein